MDHRRLQRALFRMQCDPGFAARVRAGERGAVASTALGKRELACLRAADAVAIAADRDGRRVAQLLRNVSSEFRLSIAVGPRADADASWVERFVRSPLFHDAVSSGSPFPLVFSAFAQAVAASAPSAVFRAVVTLESAMTRVRRAERRTPDLVPGAVIRVSASELVDLPAGTHAAAMELLRAAEAGGSASPASLAVDDRERETLLLAPDPRADRRFGRLPALRVEPVSPLVARFLHAAARPLSAGDRATFAVAHDLDAAAVEAVVDEYVAERMLVRGASGPGAPARV